MMNPIASEAIFSATYVDNYIDSVENLPDDVQRQLSRIRDIDVQYRTHLRDVDHYYDLWKTLQNSGAASANRRSRAIVRMQQSLIHAQELGDEKMQIVNQLQELIDHKTRQLDSNQKNLDIKEEQHLDELQFAATPSKGASTQSPTRDNVPAASQSSTGDNNLAKEHAYGAAVNSVGATNGSSTPTADRSAHMINGAQQSNANGSSSSVLTSGNNSNLSAADSQRSASKRSRRRIEITHMELCGNESNSAIETASVDKNCTASALGQKQSVSAGCSSSTQKKHTAQGLNTIGSVAGGTLAAGGIVVNAAATTNNSSKKKKRKSRGAHSSNAREETPPPDPIDPDEPTYCLCDQISFGEMILCDNDLCPIEWFHFSCVSLVLKPKGKWYCPNCRGDRPNLMKPKAQFLKELERYNKEKEEKT